MYFNVFEAAPENERDGPTQQAAQNAGGKVCIVLLPSRAVVLADSQTRGAAARVFFVGFVLMRRISNCDV
jgi:hypothetical protein